MYAYHGRYLRVDLSDGCHRWHDLSSRTLRRFIGGVGLGAFLLYREGPAKVEPLAEQSPLIFTLSPLVGTPLTTSAKFAVLAKSPLTYRISDALVSSGFAIAAKKAGLDALVVTGRLSAPGVLVIDDGRVSVHDGGWLWGMSAQQAGEHLSRRLGSEFSIAAIGPAGERLVRFATISHDGRHAGRGGLGAVMGSKQLKAIAVRGSRHISLADPQAVAAASQDLSRRSFGPATAKYRELGTAANLLALNRLSALPTRNFRQGTFEQAEDVSGEQLALARRQARRSCANCTIGCEHIYRIGSQGRSARIEYQNLFALGPLCGVGDADAVLEASRRCDELGLDTISAGHAVAFAMECAERGLIDRPGLRFGNAQAMLKLLDGIGHREGLGDLLAEGTRLAAQRIGHTAHHYALHVKGLEVPGYEPRAMQTMALGLAVSTRGADHNRSGAYEADLSEGVDRLHGTAASAAHAVRTEDRAALIDSLIFCKFLRGVFSDFFAEAAQLLSVVTGWDMTPSELRTTAARIVTAKKLYNIREGWTRREDWLPQRLLSEALPDGVATGTVLTPQTLNEMIEAYYRRRGWTRHGLVPEPLIHELGLDMLVNDNPTPTAGLPWSLSAVGADA